MNRGPTRAQLVTLVKSGVRDLKGQNSLNGTRISLRWLLINITDFDVISAPTDKDVKDVGRNVETPLRVLYSLLIGVANYQTVDFLITATL